MEGENDIEIEVVRYFAANRAAMPFERTAFPGLTLSGVINIPHAQSIALSTVSGDWEAKTNERVTFPTGLIDDGFLHVSLHFRCGSHKRLLIYLWYRYTNAAQSQQDQMIRLL